MIFSINIAFIEIQLTDREYLSSASEHIFRLKYYFPIHPLSKKPQYTSKLNLCYKTFVYFMAWQINSEENISSSSMHFLIIVKICVLLAVTVFLLIFLNIALTKKPFPAMTRLKSYRLHNNPLSLCLCFPWSSLWPHKFCFFLA